MARGFGRANLTYATATWARRPDDIPHVFSSFIDMWLLGRACDDALLILALPRAFTASLEMHSHEPQGSCDNFTLDVRLCGTCIVWGSSAACLQLGLAVLEACNSIEKWRRCSKNSD